jgi:hypothetical protein
MNVGSTTSGDDSDATLYDATDVVVDAERTLANTLVRNAGSLLNVRD